MYHIDWMECWSYLHARLHARATGKTTDLELILALSYTVLQYVNYWLKFADDILLANPNVTNVTYHSKPYSNPLILLGKLEFGEQYNSTLMVLYLCMYYPSK